MTNVKALIGTLEVNDKITFKYKGEEYRLDCYDVYGNEKKYSVWTNKVFGEGMNIEKFGGACAWLFTYDMMKNRTTYKLKFEDMEVIEVIRGEEAE